VEELLIFLVLIERDDRNSIFELIPKRVHCVVNNYQVFKVSAALKDAEVFDVEAVRVPDAAVPVEPHLKDLSLRVQQVQDHIRIGLVTCCEHHHLHKLTSSSDAILSVWTDVDACCGFVSVGKDDVDDFVHLAVLKVFDAVDQGLVQVKDDGFLDLRIPERW